MARIKQFLIYILIIIGAYFLFSFLATGFITNSYKTIEKYEILTKTPSVQIMEGKATYINGYIVGRVTNNTDALIHSEYIKFDFYNERNSHLGTKYVELDNFQVGKTLEFKVNFNYEGIQKFTVDFVSEAHNEYEEVEVTPFYHFLGLASIIILIYYIF